MHPDELNIGAPLVRRLIAGQFPQWIGRPVRRVESAGTVHAIFRIGETLVARLPLTKSHAGAVDREARLVRMLAPDLPLEIPTFVACGSPADGYPFKWAVYRWIRGDVWTSDRIGDLRVAAEDLAAFVKAIQTIDRCGPRAPGWRGRPLGDADLLIRRAIAAAASLVPADRVTAAWEEALNQPGWEKPAVWLHGDLIPTNLLVENGRLRAVIDFGCCGIGDPAVEFRVGTVSAKGTPPLPRFDLVRRRHVGTSSRIRIGWSRAGVALLHNVQSIHGGHRPHAAAGNPQ